MAGGFQSYSTTPGSNTSINGINIAEGCPPSGVNDALRQLAADGTSLWQSTPTWMGTTGGSAAAYTLTPTVALAAYTTGQSFRALTSFANTAAAPTLNISGLGAKTVVRADGSAVGIGDIANATVIDLLYDGTSFRLETVPAQVSAGYTGLKNAIINGDMRVAQRGTSFSAPAASTYTLDRWVIGYDGTAGTFVVSQANIGVTNAPSKYAFSWAQTVAGSGGTFRQIIQRIEGVHQFAGQTVTVSFNAYTSGSSFTLGTLLGQVFGSGGSPSASVFTATQNVTVSGSTTRSSLTFAIPAITGKTLGSAGDDYLELVFSTPVNATFSLLLWDVLVELGSAATAFERRPLGLEMALCQRYYETGFITMRGYFGGATNVLYSSQFHASKRAAPTMVYANNGGTGTPTDDASSTETVACYYPASASTITTILATFTALSEL
jgi:hypothetical protein